MNEVQAIVERCALATVVGVKGSSYRRPGARMLVGGMLRDSEGSIHCDAEERRASVAAA